VTPLRPAPPVLALTQGDPAGVGPEILVKLLAERFQAAAEGGAGGAGPPASGAPDAPGQGEDRRESPRRSTASVPAGIGARTGNQSAGETP